MKKILILVIAIVFCNMSLKSQTRDYSDANPKGCISKSLNNDPALNKLVAEACVEYFKNNKVSISLTKSAKVKYYRHALDNWVSVKNDLGAIIAREAYVDIIIQLDDGSYKSDYRYVVAEYMGGASYGEPRVRWSYGMTYADFYGKKTNIDCAQKLKDWLATDNSSSAKTNQTNNNNDDDEKETKKSPPIKTNAILTPYSEKHSNGKLKVSGQKSADGMQEGEWKYFDVNGKLQRIENYVGGVAEGEWKYFTDGKLTKTENYKGGALKKKGDDDDEKDDDKD